MSTDAAPPDRVLIQELAARLRSLDANCLDGLQRGLAAMAGGDFSVQADPVTEPIVSDSDDADLRALVDLFNAMLHRSQAALEAYEDLRADLSTRFGERSCLPQLEQALHSLNNHCLSDLDTGLQAMADGDLTRSAAPVTRPLRPAPGEPLGSLGELFNEMLARSRTALRSYEAVREDLRVALGDRSCLDELRSGLQSLQRHCLRDIEEALEAHVHGTTLTRSIGPVTQPIAADVDPSSRGDLAALFDRALARARTSVEHLQGARPFDRLRPGA